MMRELAQLAIAFLFAVIANVNAEPPKKYPSDLSLRPPRDCGPVCAIYCPYGNVLDWRGCPTCKCKEKPPVLPPKDCGPICRMYCPNGFVTDKRGCPICKCKQKPPVLPSKDCGPICRMYCPNGFVKDKRGCPICKCKPFKPPVKPPIKPPVCGPVCLIHCPFGNVLDHRGCPTCTCKKPPTPILRCPRGYVPMIPKRTCKKSIMPIFGDDTCGKRGICYTKGSTRSGICCRRRRRIPIGKCPPPIKSTILCKRIVNECKSDRDCKRGKCCPGRCGRVCTPTMPFILPRPRLPKPPGPGSYD